MSVLAHDLRGPLSTARLSTQVLIRNPETLDRRREVAVRVELALNRMDGMAHGGEVTLTSNEREGTTFAIDLPTDSRPFQAT